MYRWDEVIHDSTINYMRPLPVSLNHPLFFNVYFPHPLLPSPSMPYPDKGYWIDRSSYKKAGDVYLCARDTCPGFEEIADEYKDGSDLHSIYQCWTYAAFYNASSNWLASQCSDSSDLQCSPGSQGPMCGSCKVIRSHALSPTPHTCNLYALALAMYRMVSYTVHIPTPVCGVGMLKRVCLLWS